MRARLIKPGFFKNEDLARLHPLGRLLFVGLWTLADRDGRLEDRPARIRIELFPYDPMTDRDLETRLEELEIAGFIRRYAHNGRRCILIPTFLEHQKPHMREAKSTLPDPPRFAEGAPRFAEGTPRFAEGAPRWPVLDPVPVPVSVPVPETGTDPVLDPGTDPVSQAAVENLWIGGSQWEAILALTRRALAYVRTPHACSDEELVDTVQWYAQQKHFDLTPAQARDALAIVLPRRARPREASC